ncbi:MAG TPA: NfeD family protein [Steroidobacteraceae bacterium]|nr:NfeD family protein [Steroidobacteraceae bacterium]
MKIAVWRAWMIVAAAVGAALAAVAHASTAGSVTALETPVTVLEINGAIGPATARYVVRGIESAQKDHSRLVILEVDTPGGLDTSMRDIIRAILASSVPVATYVAPSGARAASAGTYILYASHVAAMAPATNLGAATPVSIGGEPPQAPGDRGPESTGPDEKGSQEQGPEQEGSEQEGSAQKGQKGQKGPQKKEPKKNEPEKKAQEKSEPVPATAMERKVVNDAVAYIRGLAELRDRNAEWAEEAVRGAASLSASAALQQKVIDVIARDIPDLLAQIDGREVKLGDHTVKLATRGLAVRRLKPDWRTQLLAVITNPTVAYGLMLIGIYGLLFEGYNPGAVFPGVVGTICLLLALFAFQILSVNYAGLALVALGVGMIIAEFFFPTFGSLGLGGLIAFVIGSLILFDTDVPGMNIALPLIAAVATVGGILIIGIVYFATHSMRRPVVTGVQGMIGDNAEVTEGFSGGGRVRYRGELWKVRSGAELRPGQMVRIVKVEGLTLWVEPL